MLRPDPSDFSALQITTRFHLTPGAAVHIGDPARTGIKDPDHPDSAVPVTVRLGEITLIQACGLISQLAGPPPLLLPMVITHSPGTYSYPI
jgi:uncharacterized protein YcsI (UPF0317 family)